MVRVAQQATKPSSFKTMMKPLLRNDLLYHVVMTKSVDYLLTLHILKATRIQLREVRRRFGMRVYRYDLGQGLQMEFDLSNDHDAFLYNHLLTYGYYEREVTSALSGLITEKTTFIDVGANGGYFSILFSKRAQTIYAFEPVESAFERLSRNISLNRLNNVRAFQLAVLRERKSLRLFESRISNGHDSAIKRFEHDKFIFVDAVTLDETVDPSVRDVVMKVDAEGSEMDVLIGASSLIKSGKVSAVVLEWARGIYSHVTDLRERFALYSSLGSVEVLDDHLGPYVVRDRSEIPDFCNLLIRIRR